LTSHAGSAPLSSILRMLWCITFRDLDGTQRN
jgi:hypothetical protein